MERSIASRSEPAPGQALQVPRAAAIAGVIFSVLMAVALGIVRVAVPANPASLGTLPTDPNTRRAMGFALQLVPFAGVAFLWWMGVLRSRLGKREDQFFATVSLGSGLLFLMSLFAGTAISGALLEQMASGNGSASNLDVYEFARRCAHAFVNIFAIKMAAVFMFSTCAISLRTGILPRWVAFSGFACGLVLVFAITNWAWIALIFPLWMLVVSTYVLVGNLHHEPDR